MLSLSCPQTRFQLDSPVTHLHSSVSSFDLVTAAFGGQLAVYDTRFARRPRLRLRGHVNTCSTQLGMTIAGDVLLAAGDDTQIRAWSILTGEAVRPLVPSEDETTERQLLGRIFDEPVRSMAYAPRHGKRSGTLFVATGGGLECYAVP